MFIVAREHNNKLHDVFCNALYNIRYKNDQGTMILQNISRKSYTVVSTTSKGSQCTYEFMASEQIVDGATKKKKN